jgi:hypothetical protein
VLIIIKEILKEIVSIIRHTNQMLVKLIYRKECVLFHWTLRPCDLIVSRRESIYIEDQKLKIKHIMSIDETNNTHLAFVKEKNLFFGFFIFFCFLFHSRSDDLLFLIFYYFSHRRFFFRGLKTHSNFDSCWTWNLKLI